MYSIHARNKFLKHQVNPVSRTEGDKRVLWFWQSNPNPRDNNEAKQWTRYSDFEIPFIEQAFKRKEKQIELNDYIINFEQKIQFKKNDRQQWRPVKREKVKNRNYVREERFSYPVRAKKSFESGNDWVHSFVRAWDIKNEQITNYNTRNWQEIAELAAQGILKEGKMLNEEFDAERMAEELRSCDTQTRGFGGGGNLCACAARLYSAESFLYKLLNSTMRNFDETKVDTLGPLCFLLFNYVSNHVEEDKDQIRYRGMQMTDEMLDEYKAAIGQLIRWPAFTSTTKNRQVAEQFGNALFIILVKHYEMLRQDLSDISSLSLYPEEEEVLLGPQSEFEVTKIEYDPVNEKHLIYLEKLVVI